MPDKKNNRAAPSEKKNGHNGAAVMDKKSGKEKRRAYCRAKPKAPAKKKT